MGNPGRAAGEEGTPLLLLRSICSSIRAHRSAAGCRRGRLARWCNHRSSSIINHQRQCKAAARRDEQPGGGPAAHHDGSNHTTIHIFINNNTLIIMRSPRKMGRAPSHPSITTTQHSLLRLPAFVVVHYCQISYMMTVGSTKDDDDAGTLLLCSKYARRDKAALSSPSTMWQISALFFIEIGKSNNKKRFPRNKGLQRTAGPGTSGTRAAGGHWMSGQPTPQERQRTPGAFPPSPRRTPEPRRQRRPRKRPLRQRRRRPRMRRRQR